MGMLAAENAIAPQKHDLWSVNTDSEYVEEASANAQTTASNENQPKRKRSLLRQLTDQFTRYLFTGGAATIVDVLVFAILTQSDLWYIWAVCISYLVGMSTNFWLSRRFVFGIYWRNWWVQYVVFAAIATNSFLANLGLLQLLVNELQWHPTWSRIVSAACVAVLSFTGHKLYSFAEQPSERFGNSPKTNSFSSSSINQ
jgi:putative flippase GtrA